MVVFVLLLLGRKGKCVSGCFCCLLKWYLFERIKCLTEYEF